MTTTTFTASFHVSVTPGECKFGTTEYLPKSKLDLFAEEFSILTGVRPHEARRMAPAINDFLEIHQETLRLDFEKSLRGSVQYVFYEKFLTPWRESLRKDSLRLTNVVAKTATEWLYDPEVPGGCIGFEFTISYQKQPMED